MSRIDLSLGLRYIVQLEQLENCGICRYFENFINFR